jgi:hypothetical protein
VQTTTFFAYKGGTGRSLMLANAAKYLARLGQTVFALDLDLEAPGLHYKLRLDCPECDAITSGVVDYISSFRESGVMPESLAPYTVSIDTDESREGRIILMPAGNVLSSSYWRRLSRINWQEFFYSEGSQGVPFFLELKERIAQEFNVDFLLIDARTGITEVGGIATTLLPDQVVCLLLNNRENLEGAREVLRSIRRAKRLPTQAPIEIIPVLSRTPNHRHRHTVHERLVTQVREFLVSDSDGTEEPMAFKEILHLHTEESLQIEETLRIGGKRTVDESPLLRDYLRIFSKLFPNEMVAPHLDNLIQAAQRNLVDDPEGTQSELESISLYCPHPSSYLALLKFYRLRNVDGEKLLQAAMRYWELSRDSSNPLLMDVIRSKFIIKKERDPSGMGMGDFIESVWTANGGEDVEVGLRLAELFVTYHDERRAQLVVNQLLFNVADEESIIRSVGRMIDIRQFDFANELIVRFKDKLSVLPDFQVVWAKLIADRQDVEAARELLNDKSFRPAQLQAAQPMIYAKLLKLAGNTNELTAAMRTILDQALLRRNSASIFEVAQLFYESGLHEEFVSRVKETMPPQRAREVLHALPWRIHE